MPRSLPVSSECREGMGWDKGRKDVWDLQMGKCLDHPQGWEGVAQEPLSTWQRALAWAVLGKKTRPPPDPAPSAGAP